MSEEQNKAPNEGEARVLSDDELKGIVGGGIVVGGGAAVAESAKKYGPQIYGAKVVEMSGMMASS